MGIDPITQSAEPSPLLRAVNLHKAYVRGVGWAKDRPRVEPLRGVDLDLPTGSSLALLGGSGSGKSTLARCLALLAEPDSGEIWFGGKCLNQLERSSIPSFRRKIQLIFQDPGLSLNPRFTAEELVSEPMLLAGTVTKAERTARALELMNLVGLGRDSAGRLPRDFSGGQRRRLAIARALAVAPQVLILDEALAGLDLSTQAQISKLLLDLQQAHGLTYLWISHDLSLVARLADRIAVIDEGKIVESASTSEFFARPRSRPGQVLVEAARAWQLEPN